MLVNLNEILCLAEREKFAVPAFNVYNMETVMGIAATAEELHAPVILQCYSRLFTNGEAYYLAPIIRAAAEKASVPICFHLDHGAGEPEVAKAIRWGASGIMIDHSALDFEDNVRKTAEITALCGAVGIPVEGELGHVGSVNDTEASPFTDIQEAKVFVERTGVAALAIQVGTAHGRYKQQPKLDIQRIADIHAVSDVHLVLHGGSGVPDEQLLAAIRAGIRKINFGTDVCYAFLDQVFATSRDLVAIDLFMKEAIDNVKRFATGKIELLGAKQRV